MSGQTELCVMSALLLTVTTLTFPLYKYLKIRPLLYGICLTVWYHYNIKSITDPVSNLGRKGLFYWKERLGDSLGADPLSHRDRLCVSQFVHQHIMSYLENCISKLYVHICIQHWGDDSVWYAPYTPLA